MSSIEYTDRYGGQAPDPSTVCSGPCEGLGVVPVYMRSGDPNAGQPGKCCPPDEEHMAYRMLWHTKQQDKPSADGYHFVPCLECSGSGKRK